MAAVLMEGGTAAVFCCLDDVSRWRAAFVENPIMAYDNTIHVSSVLLIAVLFVDNLKIALILIPVSRWVLFLKIALILILVSGWVLFSD